MSCPDPSQPRRQAPPSLADCFRDAFVEWASWHPDTELSIGDAVSAFEDALQDAAQAFTDPRAFRSGESAEE